MNDQEFSFPTDPKRVVPSASDEGASGADAPPRQDAQAFGGRREVNARARGWMRGAAWCAVIAVLVAAVAVGYALGRRSVVAVRTEKDAEIQSLLESNRRKDEQLATTVKRLEDREEELGAANKLLGMSNAQLVASNKQLTASNKELATSKKELTASNGQLAESNKQLTASNQQLAGSNEQLTMSNKRLYEEYAALKSRRADRDSARAGGRPKTSANRTASAGPMTPPARGVERNRHTKPVNVQRAADGAGHNPRTGSNGARGTGAGRPQ